MVGLQSRAPLGNKTTNAKARAGQTVGVKDIVKEIEKTQVKPTTAKKISQKPTSSELCDFGTTTAHEQATHDDEPEYAPLRPKALPYESDILPPGGLSFNGLKKENLFRGYYENFYNSVDESGNSREERAFAEEMRAVMTEAMQRNEQQANDLDWNAADVPSTIRASQNSRPLRKFERPLTIQSKKPGFTNLSTVASRKAASALAVRRDANKPLGAVGSLRKTPSSVGPARSAMKAVSNPLTAAPINTVGEAASRTTLGYNKGKSASSMIRARAGAGPSQLHPKPSKSLEEAQDELDLAITSGRVRSSERDNKTAGTDQQPRLQFLSIFQDDDGEDGLLPMSGPEPESDDDEEFELRLDI